MQFKLTNQVDFIFIYSTAWISTAPITKYLKHVLFTQFRFLPNQVDFIFIYSTAWISTAPITKYLKHVLFTQFRFPPKHIKPFISVKREGRQCFNILYIKEATQLKVSIFFVNLSIQSFKEVQFIYTSLYNQL